MRRVISFGYREVGYAICGYISLPIFVFLFGFLKWYFAIAGAIALCLAVYCGIRGGNASPAFSHKTNITIVGLAAVGLTALLWSYLGGQNGYFYQSEDWSARNAVFHDLIQYEWPVRYPSSGSALVYYIGHWLPPAAFGKLVLAVTGSFRWAWFLGKMALWGWTSLGLTIIILLIFHFLNASSAARKTGAVLLLVFFSGMDILGGAILGKLGQLLDPATLHLEWWSNYQFSSITTCLFWVFNQSVVPWMITLCVLMEDDPIKYVFYGTGCLLCGPFPLVGIAILMIIKTTVFVLRRVEGRQWRDIPRRIFSPGNLLVFIFVFPCVAAYLLSNNAVSAAGSQEIAVVQNSFFSRAYWTGELILFLTLEAGVFLMLIFPEHRKNPLYYGLIFTFLICPFFHVGAGQDFCMRVSVPAIFVLMLYTADFLQNTFFPANGVVKGKIKVGRVVRAWVLVICLCIGAVTPLVEIYRGFYHVVTEGTIKLEDKRKITFDNGEISLNFNSTDPETYFFFRFYAKDPNILD